MVQVSLTSSQYALWHAVSPQHSSHGLTHSSWLVLEVVRRASSGPFDLAEQYVALLEAHPPPGGDDALLSHAVFHLRRLCRTPLTEYGLLSELKECKTLKECAAVMQKCAGMQKGALAPQGRRRPPSYWKRQQKRNKM